MYGKKDSKRMLGKPKPLTAKGAPKVAKKKATMTPMKKAKLTVGIKPMSPKPISKLTDAQIKKIFKNKPNKKPSRSMYGR